MKKQLPFRAEGAATDYLLNPAERKILEILSEGFTRSEAASMLNMSKFTADGHLRSIFTKLDVHGTTSAVAKALRRGEIH